MSKIRDLFSKGPKLFDSIKKGFTIKSTNQYNKANLSASTKRQFNKAQSFFRVQKVSPVNYISKAMVGTSFAVGATAMLSTAIMRGMFKQAGDIMDRQTGRDMRYAQANMATMTNVGRRGKTMNLGNHTGLGLALYKRRHG